MAVSLAQVKQGIAVLQDLEAAWSSHFKDVGADEALITDGVQLAVPFVPGLAPIATLLPLAELIGAWAFANNLSGTPGSQTPIRDTRRGSDPW